MLTRRRLIVIAVILVGIVLLVIGKNLLQTDAPKPARQVTTPTVAAAKPINRGLPTRLKIPTLGIDAPVGYMGLTKTGEMDTPKRPNEVGWYKYGPLPGNTGSAVISGHVVGLNGGTAIFGNLSKMKAGDYFYVTDSSGQSTEFVVQKTQTYDHDEQPAEVFNSNEGAHLNLITCSGDWDAKQHRYLARLVVFGDKTTQSNTTSRP